MIQHKYLQPDMYKKYTKVQSSLFNWAKKGA